MCKCSQKICIFCFFFQAEDGIRDLVRSRGLGDVYKRQQQRKGAKTNRRIGQTAAGAVALGLADGKARQILGLSLIHI